MNINISIITQSNIIIYTLFRIRTDCIATELDAARPPGDRLVNYSVIVNIFGGSRSGDTGYM